MRKHLETGIMVIAACAFFGLVYPELCLIDDTCTVEEQTGDIIEEDRLTEDAGLEATPAAPKTSGGGQDADKLKVLSNLPPEKIRIKSKLLKYLFGW